MYTECTQTPCLFINNLNLKDARRGTRASLRAGATNYVYRPSLITPGISDICELSARSLALRLPVKDRCFKARQMENRSDVTAAQPSDNIRLSRNWTLMYRKGNFSSLQSPPPVDVAPLCVPSVFFDLRKANVNEENFRVSVDPRDYAHAVRSIAMTRASKPIFKPIERRRGGGWKGGVRAVFSRKTARKASSLERVGPPAGIITVNRANTRGVAGRGVILIKISEFEVSTAGIIRK